jgi:hypothetical protein
MTDLAIPSLLLSKLQELESTGTHPPLFIEVGDTVVPIALNRSAQLSKQQKTPGQSPNTPLASEPNILLLLSQEQLEYWLERPESSFCNTFTCLSETQSPRADLSALSDKSRVLATTPQRAIDHIRRDNIFLSSTTTVVLAYSFIQEAEETEEQMKVREFAFLDDCRFVFTKLNPTVQIELFTDTLSHLARTPEELVEHPVTVLQSEWELPAHLLECYTIPRLATARILDTLYALQGQQYLVIHRTEVLWKTLDKRLRASIPPIPAIGIGFDRLSSLKESDAIQVGTLVAIGLNSGELLSVIRHVGEWKNVLPRFVCIATAEEAKEITTSKETPLMNNETKPIPENNEVLAGKIQMLVAKLNIDSNPEELETLKKIIKKNVPFFRRGYFTAYILRELLGGPEKRTAGKPRAVAAQATEKPAPAAKKSAAKAPREAREPREPREKEQNDAPIPEGARTLYLNIGKMRRLYAKELSQILQDQLAISREDIFSIRVHDKYSFITLSQEHADKAIEKMNGMDIRGRIAAISYSNKE